jgi:hypothetical protein
MAITALGVIVCSFVVITKMLRNKEVTEFCTPPDLMYDSTSTWCERASAGSTLSRLLWVAAGWESALITSSVTLLFIGGVYSLLGTPLRLRGKNQSYKRRQVFEVSTVITAIIAGITVIVWILGSIT